MKMTILVIDAATLLFRCQLSLSIVYKVRLTCSDPRQKTKMVAILRLSDICNLHTYSQSALKLWIVVQMMSYKGQWH